MAPCVIVRKLVISSTKNKLTHNHVNTQNYNFSLEYQNIFQCR